MGRKNRNSFSQQWASQTKLGKSYGLSAVAVGKLLVQEGLRDPETKEPTAQALADGIAISTPLRDGTPFFMWSRDKVRPIFEGHRRLSQAEVCANEVRATLRAADRLIERGDDKLGYMMGDFAYDEVPRALRAEVRRLVEDSP
jgi:hypothetical protein